MSEPVSSPTWVLALAAVLAATGPSVYVGTVLDPAGGLATGLIIAAAVVLIDRLGRRSFGAWAPAGVTAVMALVLAASASRAQPLVELRGRGVAVWAAVAVLAVVWTTLGRPPLPGMPRGDRGALPGVVVIVLVATLRGRQLGTTPVPSAITAASLMLSAVAAWLPGRVAAIARFVGQAVATLFARVAFLVLAVPVVVLPWMAGRLTGTVPLRQPTAAGSQWVPLDRRFAQPERPWSHDAAALPSPARARRRRVLVGGTVAAAVLTLLIPRVVIPAVVDDSPPRPAAAADAGWWDQYVRDARYVLQPPVWNPLRRQPVRDVSSATINVRDGVRLSWRPPACECRRLRVWVYGGSTIFGLGQRDEHTIPSELARLAAADGITLDVVNRGVSGQLLWQEVERAGWDLAGEESPDLVVFYDGGNEVATTIAMNTEGRGADESPLNSDIDEVARAYDADQARWKWLLPSPVPDGVEVHPTTTVPILPPDQVAVHAMARYSRSLRTARVLTEAFDVPAVWFWQPTRFDRPVGSEGPESDVDRTKRLTFEAARTLLPEGVVDLSQVLDEVGSPLYLDELHTNEIGARLVAEAMYAQLRPQLRELANG